MYDPSTEELIGHTGYFIRQLWPRIKNTISNSKIDISHALNLCLIVVVLTDIYSTNQKDIFVLSRQWMVNFIEYTSFILFLGQYIHLFYMTNMHLLFTWEIFNKNGLRTVLKKFRLYIYHYHEKFHT